MLDLVYHAVLSALTQEDRIEAEEAPAAKPAAAPTPVTTGPTYKAAPRPDFYRSMSSESFRAQGYSVKPAPASQPAASVPVRAAEIPYQTRMDMPPIGHAAPAVPVTRPQTTENTAFRPDSTAPVVENPVQNVEKLAVPDHKIVGEALKLYILVEMGEELILIDKHAAHERMIFDRLKQQERSIMAQELLTSVPLRLTEEDRELIDINGALLSELGFEIEPFGEHDYVLRTVPSDMAPSDAEAAVEEILDKLKSGKAPDPQSARDEILHTVACKAAIKAGYDTTREELQRIVDAVLSGAVKYCPHGRPVSAVMTRRDLDKLFKRIV